MNKKRLYTNTCKACCKVYHPHSKKQAYCSNKCAGKIRGDNRRDRVSKICANCRETFRVKRYREKTAKYCSKKCWATRSPIRKKKCEFCDSQFETYDDKQKFCGHPCAGKSRTGKAANAYKHGKSTQTDRGRLSDDLTRWRQAVYKRDNYTCQQCGKKGGLLHAHHIKSFADYPDIRLDIDNGMTVCVPCHEVIHGRKISGPGKYPKNCIDCGADISGKSFRCQSCGVAHSWTTKRHRSKPKKCPICYKIFKKRRNQIFCSVSCSMKHRHSLDKTGSIPE